MSSYRHLTPVDIPLTIVEWEDIQEYPDWNEESEEHTTATELQAGWVIEDTPKALKIASGYSYAEGKWTGINTIPKLPPNVIELGIWDGNVSIKRVRAKKDEKGDG